MAPRWTPHGPRIVPRSTLERPQLATKSTGCGDGGTPWAPAIQWAGPRSRATLARLLGCSPVASTAGAGPAGYGGSICCTAQAAHEGSRAVTIMTAGEVRSGRVGANNCNTCPNSVRRAGRGRSVAPRPCLPTLGGGCGGGYRVAAADLSGAPRLPNSCRRHVPRAGWTSGPCRAS